MLNTCFMFYVRDVWNKKDCCNIYLTAKYDNDMNKN